jgi:hypothetical protein
VHAVRVNNVMTRALRALFLMMLMGVLKSIDVRRVVKRDTEMLLKLVA